MYHLRFRGLRDNFPSNYLQVWLYLPGSTHSRQFPDILLFASPAGEVHEEEHLLRPLPLKT